MDDLRFAFRQLVKDPGCTAVALLTPALHVGANTAGFNLWDTVLRQALPVLKIEQLSFPPLETDTWI